MIKKINLSNLISSFSYENFILNPGYFNGTNNWIPLFSTLSILNNNLVITGNGVNSLSRAYNQRTFNYNPANRKIFFSGSIKITNSDCISLYCAFRSDGSGTKSYIILNQLSPINNSLYNLDGVYTLPSDWNSSNIFIYIYHQYASSGAALGKTAELSKVLAIDLTELYGAGNEPSAADCANIFDFVDGTKQSNFSKQIAT
jgi:hypothetical protein